jgi:hypothetical protein
MSFERYVRIGHTCRLRACSYITEENFKYVMVAVYVVVAVAIAVVAVYVSFAVVVFI